MEDGFKQLTVYKLACKLAMEIFELSKSFPKEEKYSIADQIIRSSRSICTNIAEGYRKRKYLKPFSSKVSGSDGECSETMVWLDFSKDCNYISVEKYNDSQKLYYAVGKMLGGMSNNSENILLKNK